MIIRCVWLVSCGFGGSGVVWMLLEILCNVDVNVSGFLVRMVFDLLVWYFCDCDMVICIMVVVIGFSSVIRSSVKGLVLFWLLLNMLVYMVMLVSVVIIVVSVFVI